MFIAMAARPSWIRFLITFFFLSLSVLLWWLLSYRQLQAQVARVAQCIQEEQQQLTQQARVIHKQTIAHAESKTREEITRNAWESFFVCKQTTEFVEQLVTHAQEYNLQLSSYRLAEPQKEAWGKRIELTCELSGDFFSFISLLEQFEPMTNLIGLSCEMQSMQDQRIRSTCRFMLCCPVRSPT
jgi:hypothetical protein